MIILKIVALLLSVYILVYGAIRVKTEIGLWGFFGIIASLLWLLAK